jgi:hypothetical protein
MRAKSIKGSSTGEINTALQQSMADGYQPTLAFVFISIKQDREAVCELLDAAGISIFGATSCGEFIDSDIGKGTIAILLLDIKKSDFTILIEEYQKENLAAVSAAMGTKVLESFKHPDIIVSYSQQIPEGLIEGETIIKSLEKVVGDDAAIWGGAAGDDAQFTQTYVFTNHKSVKTGIMMLVFDADKIMLKGLAASGWKAVGTEKTITKSNGPWILEIDNQPSLEVLFKYMGLTLTKEEAETFNPATTVFSLLRSEGEPVMRSTAVFNWENKSILMNGTVKTGDKIRFTLPPDFEVVENVSRDAEQIKQTEIPDADAMVMFSCMGRLGAFGPLAGEEINEIKKSFDIPMAGFFCYGEFGRATKGNNEFHNMTCCWVAIKEK